MSIALKSHVNSQGMPFPPLPKIFLRGIFIQDGSTKIFLSVFVQISSSEKNLGVFNICCFWYNLGQKFSKFWWFPKTLFYTTKQQFEEKTFWSWKIGFWEIIKNFQNFKICDPNYIKNNKCWKTPNCFLNYKFVRKHSKKFWWIHLE